MGHRAYLSSHRRVAGPDLTRFFKNQTDRIRFNLARDGARLEEVLDAVDTSRGPLVSNDVVDVVVRR